MESSAQNAPDRMWPSCPRAVRHGIPPPASRRRVPLGARQRRPFHRDGAFAGYFGSCIDVTAHKRLEERQQLLINELNHRVKNTLAVQSIAQQSFQREASADARRVFEERLQTLSAAHDLLTQENWEAASLRQVIEEAVAVCSADRARIHVDGPDVRLSPKAAVSLAIAIHELCANAVKYGAHSGDQGGVTLAWRIGAADPPHLNVSWRERGGPTVADPPRRGFGSRMLERGLAGELRGAVRLDFRPEGVVCRIDAPIPVVSTDPQEPEAAR